MTNRSKIRTLAGYTAAALLAAACSGGGGGGGGGGGTNTNPVTRVEVNGPSSTVQVGQTLQLSAAAFTARGPATGKTPSWSSNNEAVASVSASGLVSGVAEGTAVISATVDGIRGQRSITVTPVPVASVTLARDTATLVAGATLQLSATARNASGAAIPGAEITWSSLNAGRATVSGTGLVTTLATGSARIVAASNGKKDTATITVLSRTAAEIELEPAFATANVGAQTALTLTVLTAAGLEVPGPVVNWSIPDGGTRTATSFSSVAAGRFRVGAQVDAIADTAVIAVLGPSSILVTAWPGSTFSSQRARGATFTVPVVIDMTRASATGDLGSFQMDLSYDPAVLQYVSNTPKASGTLDVNGAGAGLVRIAFAHTGAQGSGKFTLVNLTFRVRADAAVGRRQAFEISAPVRPSSSSFTLYQPVVGVGGTVRVVSP